VIGLVRTSTGQFKGPAAGKCRARRQRSGRADGEKWRRVN